MWYDDVDIYTHVLYDESHEGFYLGFAGFVRIIIGFVSFTHIIR